MDFFWKALGLARRGYLIHLITNGHNTRSWLTAGLTAVAGSLAGKRSVLTLGSGDMPAFVQRQSWWRRQLLLSVLSGFRRVMVRNPLAFDTVQKLGVPERRLCIVPPYTGEVEAAGEEIPDRVQKFISAHRPVLVSAVAYRPEYGIDLSLEAIRTLLPKHPQLGLILLGPESGGQSVQAEIDARGLTEQVLLAGALSHPAYLATVKQSTVFLRSTDFDGDASSVREALALGVPAVVSRTEFRPEGSVLFDVGRLDDLTAKLEQVLAEPDRYGAEECLDDTVFERLGQILAVYRDVLLETGLSQEQLPELMQS